MRKTALLLGVMVLACGACSNGRLPDVSAPDSIALNSSPQPIDVRYGLDVKDIELAILLAVVNPTESPDLAPGQTITNEVLEKIVSLARKGNPWAYESRQPGYVYARYVRDSTSMRVAIRFDEQLVMLRIVDSKNLGQYDEYIRQEALGRLIELDNRIRATVISVAQRNQYGVPVPASR